MVDLRTSPSCVGYSRRRSHCWSIYPGRLPDAQTTSPLSHEAIALISRHASALLLTLSLPRWSLQEANRWEELLAPELAKARKALEHWRAMTVNDAKLARLLRDGASTGVLARAIQVRMWIIGYG